MLGGTVDVVSGGRDVVVGATLVVVDGTEVEVVVATIVVVVGLTVDVVVVGLNVVVVFGTVVVVGGLHSIPFAVVVYVRSFVSLFQETPTSSVRGVGAVRVSFPRFGISVPTAMMLGCDDFCTIAGSGSDVLSNTIVAVLVPFTHETDDESVMYHADAGAACHTTRAVIAARIASVFFILLPYRRLCSAALVVNLGCAE